ncbi:GvpL/GvpF family gas vesicle protein [Spirillospora sp. CA-294931]|uniref:GvpL/GvpF family gas vesicle protein n=1 Tax=Spirillospora sp. CA-294931 TaxID=3240042 RepID=UPI003D949E13
MTDQAVYMYAVARDLDPGVLAGVTGVAGEPVRAVADGRLSALVGTVPTGEYGEDALRANLEDLAWLEATARAHHDVVDRAAHVAATAPVRIATLYRDDARVAALLAERHEQFDRVLAGVTGRSEWGVKAYSHPDPQPKTPVAEEPPPDTGTGAGAGVGTAYLRRRQAAQRARHDAHRRDAAQAQAVHAELCEHALASRTHPPQDPRLSGRDGTPILNVAYLLDDDHADAFAAAVGDIDARLPGVTVELTGPWPPYSFIEGIGEAP